MVLLLDRGAEDGHDPVPHVGDQGAAVVEDRVAHLLQVAVEDVDHPVGLEQLRERGEAAQVAEEDGALAAHAAETQVGVVDPLEDFVDDRFGHEAGEGDVDALALEGGHQVVDGERSEGREGQSASSG